MSSDRNKAAFQFEAVRRQGSDMLLSSAQDGQKDGMVSEGGGSCGQPSHRSVVQLLFRHL